MLNEREEEIQKAKEIALARFYVEQKQQRREDRQLTYVIITGIVVFSAIVVAGVAL